MVFSMACQNVVFLGESLSMSKYDVIVRKGWGVKQRHDSGGASDVKLQHDMIAVWISGEAP